MKLHSNSKDNWGGTRLSLQIHKIWERHYSWSIGQLVLSDPQIWVKLVAHDESSKKGVCVHQTRINRINNHFGKKIPKTKSTVNVNDHNQIKSNQINSSMFILQHPPTEFRERESESPAGTCPCAKSSSFARSTFDPQSAWSTGSSQFLFFELSVLSVLISVQELNLRLFVLVVLSQHYSIVWWRKLWVLIIFTFCVVYCQFVTCSKERCRSG